MFNVPKNDDFDEAALEDELEAILSGRQPVSTRSNEQSRPKPENSRNQKNQRSADSSRTTNSRSNRSNDRSNNRSNAYDFNLEALGNLNLNDDTNDDFDDDDPDLNAELSAMIGDELPTYAQSNLIHQQTQMLKPTRPAPPVIKPISINQPTNQSTNQPTNQPTNQSSCLMLDNSHFVGDPIMIPQQINKTSNSDQVTKEQLIELKDECRRLALDAKHSNDLDNAKVYLLKMKQIDAAIECLNNGQPVDLSQLSLSNSISQSFNEQTELNEDETRKLFKVPEPANSLLEALNQRKQKLESTLAKEQAANNATKVRMMNRLIKQYENAIKANKAGKSFDYASLPDIPGFDELPPVSNQQSPIKKTNDSSVSNRPKNDQQQSSKPSPIKDTRQQLEKWKDEFKVLALDAKRLNDLENAKIYLLKMKEISTAIDSINNGQSVDLNSISSPDSFKRQMDATQNLELNAEETKRLFNAPSPAKSLLGALEQCRSKYQSTLEKEQAANNVSKVKMLNRIIKQYDNAIKANKQNKEFDYESLPIPPGFSELPINENKSSKPSIQPPTATVAQSNKPSIQPPTTATVAQSNKPSIQPPTTATVAQSNKPSTATKVKPPFKRTISVNNKQLDYLIQRQKLFKEAAVEANRKGDQTQALDYLRKSKGFQPLIDAVQGGLPIDVSNIPIPPQLDNDDFIMVSKSSENLNLDLDTAEHYRKLELELDKQISLCDKNKEYFYKIGDVSTGSKFEKYLIDMNKDREMLKSYKLRGEPVPKYHYELKEFSIVVCNTDLSNNEILFEIIRAIDLPSKQPVDSFVKFDFPFPKDKPQSARTHSAKNTLYPEYNQSFKFSIDRKARSLARIFTKAIKMEIYSKGGFFKSDELIGNVTVDLSSLRTRCTLFDSFPILIGRRETGGKLQIKIKLREPLLAKQVEEIKEKWLVFNY